MARYFDDCRSLSGWTESNYIGATDFSISGDAIVKSVANLECLALNSIEPDAERQNAEIVLKLKASGTGTQFCGIVRGTGTTLSSASGSVVALRFNGATSELRLYKKIDGTLTQLVASPQFTTALDTYYWVRFRAQGENLYAKYWKDGENEPAAWLIGPHQDASISSSTDGFVGIHGSNAAVTCSIGAFGAATGGDTAPTSFAEYANYTPPQRVTAPWVHLPGRWHRAPDGLSALKPISGLREVFAMPGGSPTLYLPGRIVRPQYNNSTSLGIRNLAFGHGFVSTSSGTAPSVPCATQVPSGLTSAAWLVVVAPNALTYGTTIWGNGRVGVSHNGGSQLLQFDVKTGTFDTATVWRYPYQSTALNYPNIFLFNWLGSQNGEAWAQGRRITEDSFTAGTAITTLNTQGGATIGTNGTYGQGVTIAFVALFNRSLTADESSEYSANPWALFAQNRQAIYSLPPIAGKDPPITVRKSRLIATQPAGEYRRTNAPLAPAVVTPKRTNRLALPSPAFALVNGVAYTNTGEAKRTVRELLDKPSPRGYGEGVGSDALTTLADDYTWTAPGPGTGDFTTFIRYERSAQETNPYAAWASIFGASAHLYQNHASFGSAPVIYTGASFGSGSVAHTAAGEYKVAWVRRSGTLYFYSSKQTVFGYSVGAMSNNFWGSNLRVGAAADGMTNYTMTCFGVENRAWSVAEVSDWMGNPFKVLLHRTPRIYVGA